jgi:DNA segregation ATPase FtsK/SpoIIIE, S-DNA-T family
VTHRLAGALPSRLLLRLADREDYASFGLNPRRVPGTMAAGRGLWLATGEEVQVAVIGGDPAGASQAESLRALGAAAARRWQVPAARLPRRVDPLPERITLAELDLLRATPQHDRASVCVVAAGGGQLGPVDLDLAEVGGCFVVAGPPRSGRSTALSAIVGSLRGRAQGELPVLLLAPRPSPLRDLGDLAGVIDVVNDPRHLEQALDEHRGPLAVVADDAELLADGPAAVRLDQLVRAARDGQAVLVAAATTQDLLLARYRGWLADARRGRSGLLLNPTSHLDGEVFDVKLSRAVTGCWPAGRAVLVLRGVTELVQAPQP